MKEKIKLWLRRWAIRQAIKLVDHAEEVLQSWQVRLRDELAAGVVPVKQSPAVGNAPREANPIPVAAYGHGEKVGSAGRRRFVSFMEWEAQRSGVAPVSKKAARRRRGKTSAEFDLLLILNPIRRFAP